MTIISRLEVQGLKSEIEKGLDVVQSSIKGNIQAVHCMYNLNLVDLCEFGDNIPKAGVTHL